MSTRLEGRGLVVAHGPLRSLDGVDVDLHEGELLGLVGPNGSGKSTLLRVLLGAQTQDLGTVRLDGLPLSAIPPRTRARTLTHVLQAQAPDFALTVREVVGLGRIPHEGLFGTPGAGDQEKVDHALAQTDTAALADRFIGTLSSGELQRVHLARAFAQEARVLLLDEPTANLDPLHQLTALRLLRGFAAQGGAAIVVLHDLTLAARTCDRMLVLERGKVRADGPPGTALHERLLAEVFGVRARIERDAAGGIESVLAIEPSQPQGGTP